MKARLYNLNSSFLFEGQAVYKREEEKLYFKADQDIQEKGPEFLVHYTDGNQGVFDFRCAYDGFERDNLQYIIALNVLETLKSVQRRQDLKVKTNLPVKIVLLEPDDRVKIDPQTQKAMQIRAYLRDISAGGIMVSTESFLAEGQRLLIPFDKGSSPILVTAQVIREQPDAADGYRSYGCRFVNLNHGKESVIREYVFRLQLAGKNKARYPDDI